MKDKIVIIFSGGLDSTTALYYYKSQDYDVHAVSYYYGQKHAVELDHAKTTCVKLNVPHKIVDLGFMKELLGDCSALTSNNVAVPTLKQVLGEPQPITYVPFRNMLMLSIALSYAEAVGATQVCFGAQKHDEYSGYWDTTTSFVEAMNKVAALDRLHKIKIVAPFVELSKSDEIILGTELQVPYENTISCYNGTNCGTCPTCADRIKAFAVAGIKDPIVYVTPVNWEALGKYKNPNTLEQIKAQIK